MGTGYIVKINNAGTAIGYGNLGKPFMRAADGQIIDISISGADLDIRDINDRGDIAGQYRLGSGTGPVTPFIRFADGTVRDFPNADFRFEKLLNNGDALVLLLNRTSGGNRGLRRSDGRIDEFAAVAGLTVTGVNNIGQVVCTHSFTEVFPGVPSQTPLYLGAIVPNAPALP